MQVSQHEEKQVLQNLASKVTSAESEGDQTSTAHPHSSKQIVLKKK